MLSSHALYLGVNSAVGCQELDHRAERTFERQDRPRRAAAVAIAQIRQSRVSVIAVEDFFDQRHVLLEVAHMERPRQHRIHQAFADLRLAAAGDRAGFVAKRALGHRADQPPARRPAILGHADFVAARMDVNLARQQLQVLRLAMQGPRNVLAMDVYLHVLGHVVDFGVNPVGGIARWVELRAFPEEREHLLESVLPGAIEPHEIWGEAVAKTKGRERQRAAGMLLFGPAEQIRAVADLSLHFLLAIAEVIVSEDGDHHAIHVTRGDLERATLVVDLVFVGPAHACGTLSLRGLARVREANVLLLQPRKMRRQNHAAAVARPAVHIDRSVVGREIGIAGIAEDALHKVEVRDQAAGDEVADLVALLRRDPRHRRTDERPQQQRDHGLDRLWPIRSKRQAQKFGRRSERLLKQAHISDERHAGFIRGNRKPALSHVKDPLRGAAVVDRVVQNSIIKSIA